jgi:hypothetical protein
MRKTLIAVAAAAAGAVITGASPAQAWCFWGCDAGGRNVHARHSPAPACAFCNTRALSPRRDVTALYSVGPLDSS